MNMAKSNETKMNGIETLVHHSNPSNKPLNIDPKFKKLFDDIKKPKLASKQYSMVYLMGLNGEPMFQYHSFLFHLILPYCFHLIWINKNDK